MKNVFKSIVSLVLAMILILGMSISVLAANSSVTYEGGAEKFIFLPGSEHSDSDLFDGFKNVMPGDVLTETIQIENTSKNCDYVKIYMRAQVHDANGNPLSEAVAEKTDLVTMEAFLSQLTMTVWNGKEVIYQASPDELDGLSENVLLGTFRRGERTELTVELKVPIEMDNTYMNQIGEVDWVFVAEELNDPEKVQTGDSANVLLWVGIMAVTVWVIKKRIAVFVV